jgi:hypothetical protein
MTADTAVLDGSTRPGPWQAALIRLLVGIVVAAAMMVLLVKVDAAVPGASPERVGAADGAAYRKL